MCDLARGFHGGVSQNIFGNILRIAPVCLLDRAIAEEWCFDVEECLWRGAHRDMRSTDTLVNRDVKQSALAEIVSQHIDQRLRSESRSARSASHRAANGR